MTVTPYSGTYVGVRAQGATGHMRGITALVMYGILGAVFINPERGVPIANLGRLSRKVSDNPEAVELTMIAVDSYASHS